MLRVALFVFMLSACGDNLDPTLTWSDAQMEWTTAWCSYAERCSPGLFGIIYGTYDKCVTDVYAQNCADIDCKKPYPYAKYESLKKCHQELTDIDCNATEPPDSCYDAYSGVYQK